MEKIRDFKEDVDKARLMTKLSIIGVVVAGLPTVLVLALAIIGDFAGSDVFALAIIPYTLSMLFAISSVIFGVMATSAAQEEEEKRLLETRKADRMLNIEEDVRFTAGRSFENYRRFTPYVLAILGGGLTFLCLILFWRYWGVRVVKTPPAEAQLVAFVAAVMMGFSVFAGAFYVGQSRSHIFRWLQPVGAWLIMGFVVMLLATLSALLTRFGHPEADDYIARILVGVFILLGAEFIGNFIVEFYRPRTLEEPRPIFESRLLALFTEPGGVMRNIADTLDYQFGFKVSGTWIYRFTEKALFPLLIFWLSVLWLFTAIQEVGPNQVGIREHFGRIVNSEPLQPGIYLTFPYPFGNIARYSCSMIHEVTVGPKMEDEKGNAIRPKVVLWTKKHFATESRFLIAVKQEEYEETEEQDTSGGEVVENRTGAATSVSFLGTTIPIHYRITESGLIDFAYKYQDGAEVLRNIGEMEATRYFASVDFMDVMSHGRHQAGQTLKKRIQNQVDALKLGVEIVEVNLLDAHPPVEEVAPAFQNVIGALEEKESEILRAKAYQERVSLEAESQHMRLVEDATANSYKTTKVAQAESERFLKQLQAFRVMPQMYKLRTYLSLFERDAKDIRKYIISSSMAYEVYEFNFEKKQQLDLIDTDLDALKQNQ